MDRTTVLSDFIEGAKESNQKGHMHSILFDEHQPFLDIRADFPRIGGGIGSFEVYSDLMEGNIFNFEV
jgi:hypothetical protein